jgi:acyl dehydratase
MSQPVLRSLEDVEVGQELGEVVFGPLSRDDIKAYADASGDDNPIHQDESYAREQGAPTVFAMGMLNAGYLAHAVSDWFGGPQHLRRFKVRFTTRVWPGDELVCAGSITSVEGAVVGVELEARRRGDGPEGIDVADDEIALTGEAEVELPEGGSAPVAGIAADIVERRIGGDGGAQH